MNGAAPASPARRSFPVPGAAAVAGRLRADPPLAALLAAWFAARLLYWFVGGVRFDTDSLDAAYQLVHRDLLEHDLWTSLWNLHSQPPLFNLVVGLGLRLPLDPATTFGIPFRLCGLLLAVLMYRLAVELAVSRRVAALAAALFTIAPATVFYEHYLFYTMPVATLLCAAAYGLLRFLRTERARYGALFFGAVAALALTRATYHLVWVAAAAVFVAVATRRRVPARTLALIALPTLIVPALYLKNAVEFGTFSGSSWMGMNLARVTLTQADPAEVERLIERGVLSEQARIYPFEDLDTFGVAHPPTGVATLDRRWRREGKDPNLNNLDYVEISEQYQRDALAYLRRHPLEYGEAVSRALRLYLLPTTYNPHVGNNLLRVYDFTKATWLVVDLQPHPYEDVSGFFATYSTKNAAPGWTQVSLTGALTYAIVLAGWPVRLLRTRRRRAARSPEEPADGQADRGGLDRPARLTLAFVTATVSFVMLASVMLELGENNRFRFETDPLVVTVAVAYLYGTWAARPRRALKARDLL